MSDIVNDNHDNMLPDIMRIGRMADADIDLAEAALCFAARDHAGISLDRYRAHMAMLAAQVGQYHATLLAQGAVDDAQTRLSALRVTIFADHEYTGDAADYNNLENADLIRVIDRRKGMPIALAIIYIVTARAQGWEAHGLNMPGHFMARLDHGPEQLIFDPFSGGRHMDAAAIRQQLKAVMGQDAELSATYYTPASNRDILLRLQNNRKIRMIEAEDYDGALAVVQGLRAFAPDEYRLLLDEGVLSARTERNQAAIDALELYIEKAPDPQDRHDAALLLAEIKRSLN